MRTLRLSLAGTVILVLLGGLGGAVVAQDEDAAPTELPTGPALFTITEVGPDLVATDPRMSGTLVERDSNILRVPVGNHAGTARARLTNDAGAWECWSDEYGESYGHWYYRQSWCVGEGAYEGLSAIMFGSSDADTHGLIYEGAPLREPPAD